MRTLICGLLAAGLLAGCSTGYKTVPGVGVAGDGSAVRFARGHALMMSEGETGSVWLLPVRYHSGDRLSFIVVAYNKLNQPINFGVEDVEMGLEDGTPVPAFDFDALREEERRRAEGALVVSALGLGLDSWHAGQVQRRDPHMAPVFYQRGVNRYYASNAAIRAQMEDAVHTYARRVLQTTTVDPFTAFGGGVIAPQFPIAKGEVKVLLANVRFAGEDHLFRLRMAADGTPLPVERGIPAVRRRQVEGLYSSCPTWMWTESSSGCHPAPAP